MKKILALLLFSYSNDVLHGQYYFENGNYYRGNLIVEVGLSSGMMNCLTDIGGRATTAKIFFSDINWSYSRPFAGVYTLASYKDVLALRLEVLKGKILSHDSILKKEASRSFGRYERNLGFRSSILELQAALEFHPLYLISYEDEPPYLSPYLIAGIGFYRFNPEGMLEGSWYYLQPLRTEGQGFNEYPERKPYHLNQWNIPLGFGLRYELGSFTYLRFEILHRVLFTDYLDDVSKTYIDPRLFGQYLPEPSAALAKKLSNRSIPYNNSLARQGQPRGNQSQNDSYFTVALKIGMVLKRKN